MLNNLEMERYIHAIAKRGDLRVEWEDIAHPRTSGKTIYLPELKANTTEKEYKQLRHYATHEVDHQLYSDMTTETHAGVTADRSLLGAIWNMVEDHRIEFLGTSQFEGDRLNSNDVYSDLVDVIAKNAKASKNTELVDTIMPLVSWTNQVNADYYPSAHMQQDKLDASCTRTKAKEFLDKLNSGKFADELRRVREIEDPKAGSEATFQLASSIFEKVYGGDAKKEEQRCKEEYEKEQKEGKGKDGKDGKPEDKEGEGKAKKAKPGEGEGEKDEEEGPPIEADYSEFMPDKHEDKGRPKRDLHLDYGKHAMRSNYTPCGKDNFHVTDLTKMRGGSADPRGWHRNIVAAVNNTSASFANQVRTILQIRDRDRYHYGQKRGKLNTHALHRVLVKDAPGYNERVFKRREVNSVLDASVTLLVDQSGSMSGNKYAHAAAAAVMLSETIGNTLHIPTEIASFSDNGSECTIFLHRTFTDKLVSKDDLINRFAKSGEDMANNPDGDAIMWCFDRLVKRPEKRKLYVVFSDGSPASGLSRGDNTWYTKHVVSRIEKESPVSIVGIGIMDNNVTRFYTENHVIRDTTQLEKALLSVIENKLK